MTAINPVTDLSMDGDVAVITLNSPPVNALSANVREGLFEGFKAATADPAAKAIVLICEGRTFIAGADITEFGGAARGPSLLDVQEMMDNAPKPVIAMRGDDRPGARRPEPAAGARGQRPGGRPGEQ
jgi:3-hydroxyacyl-CoA dehydrogenase